MNILFTKDVYTTKNTVIRFEALPEDIEIKDMFSEEQDIKEVQEKINNYDLVLFCAKVSILVCGQEIATDYLGGCIYEYYDEFITKYKFEHFADMVSTCITEARTEINRMQSIFSTFKN